MQDTPVPAPASLDKLAYSIPEACKVVSIGRTLLYEEITAGRLKTKKVGRRTVIPRESIVAWLASLPEGAIAEAAAA